MDNAAFSSVRRQNAYGSMPVRNAESDEASHRPVQGSDADSSLEAREETLGGAVPLRRKRDSGKALPHGKHGKASSAQKLMINWAMLGVMAIVAVIALVIGAFFFLGGTAQGQLILARMGQDANADAYWALGTELLNQGNVDRAIQA